VYRKIVVTGCSSDVTRLIELLVDKSLLNDQNNPFCSVVNPLGKVHVTVFADAFCNLNKELAFVVVNVILDDPGIEMLIVPMDPVGPAIVAYPQPGAPVIPLEP
jgi:hypothetical protein